MTTDDDRPLTDDELALVAARLMALDDAVDFIRVVGEELVLAGFPAGDRVMILRNVRAMRSLLGASLKALQPFADFLDGNAAKRLPPDMPLTQGSPMARRQVTVADFMAARDTLIEAERWMTVPHTELPL